MGSCFADAIGKKLRQGKFDVMSNPFGTVYNPISIFGLLRMALLSEKPREDGFCQHDELFLHHDFHSSFVGTSKALLQEKLIDQLAYVGEVLRTCRVLIVTYGTAWVYEQKPAKQVVANCHKIPQYNFDKVLLSQKRILESFDVLYKALVQINPTVKIIHTVSPVRHVKDTLELNSVSKATLRLMCHTLKENNPNIFYFPAFEIMLDDLRDYRFYKPDLIHPSEQAEDYIWEKFATTFFSSDTLEFLKRLDKIQSALQHRPFKSDSLSHQKFLKTLLSELDELSKVVDVQAEIEQVQNQLIR